MKPQPDMIKSTLTSLPAETLTETGYSRLVTILFKHLVKRDKYIDDLHGRIIRLESKILLLEHKTSSVFIN